MFKKLLVIDAKGHLVGRLASYVAKEALNGQRISIVRSEQVLVSGSKFRNKEKVLDQRNKRMNTNPFRAFQHPKTPSQMLLRKIRGMIPHKTPIGKAALGRVKCFDGCPLSLNHKKRFVVRDALKCVRLKPRSRFCCMGDLAAVTGWTKSDLVHKFETKRTGLNREWHLRRQKTQKATTAKLANNADLKRVNEELAKLGY